MSGEGVNASWPTRHVAALRLTTLLAAAALAAGCASLDRHAPDAAEAGTLAGRLSMRVAADGDRPARSLGAAFELSGDERRGRLDLLTPLGTVLARARWSPDGAVLAVPGSETAYADLDTLARQLLGEDVPLAALFDWLRGRPWPGAPSRPLDAADGTGFEQLGWRVDLAQFADGRIGARRDLPPPAVTVQVRLDRAAPADTAPPAPAR